MLYVLYVSYVPRWRSQIRGRRRKHLHSVSCPNRLRPTSIPFPKHDRRRSRTHRKNVVEIEKSNTGFRMDWEFPLRFDFPASILEKGMDVAGMGNTVPPISHHPQPSSAPGESAFQGGVRPPYLCSTIPATSIPFSRMDEGEFETEWEFLVENE